MKKLSEILFVIAILLQVIGKFLSLLHIPPGGSLVFWSHIIFFLFILSLILEFKKYPWLYSTLLLLAACGSIGTLLKTMHWPGGGPLVLVGLISQIAIGTVLIYNSFKNPKTSLIHLALGFFILLQFVVLIARLSSDMIWYAKLINYPILGLSATLLINQQATNKGERALMMIVFGQALMFVIQHTFLLIS